MNRKCIKKLYRYQRFHADPNKHFRDLKLALAQKAWLTPLRLFNDPFEGMCHFKSENPQTQKELIELKNHGAMCLTDKNDSLLMWAHYADNHKGFCLELELDFEYIATHSDLGADNIENYKLGFENGKRIISFRVNDTPHECVMTKVIYEDQIPIISKLELNELNNRYDQKDYLTKHLFGAKFKTWEYESEYRLIINDNSVDTDSELQLCGYAPFLKITGIIMGSNIRPTDKSEIIKLWKETTLNLYIAECSKDKYKIIINRFRASSHTADNNSQKLEDFSLFLTD